MRIVIEITDEEVKRFRNSKQATLAALEDSVEKAINQIYRRRRESSSGIGSAFLGNRSIADPTISININELYRHRSKPIGIQTR